MKNIFVAGFVISIACFTLSCNKCKDVGGYHPDASQLKKYSFKPGSYWVYLDSISGIIDSQSVYDYTSKGNVVLGYTTGANADIYCPVSSDVFSMSIASFWNGVSHDSIYCGNENGQIGTSVAISYSDISAYQGYYFSIDSTQHSETLINFSVSGRVFPKVHMDISNAVIYHVDSVGVIKYVFNDTISGRHTWNLLRYHVINP